MKPLLTGWRFALPALVCIAALAHVAYTLRPSATLQQCAGTYGDLLGSGALLFVTGLCIGNVWQLYRTRGICAEAMLTIAKFKTSLEHLDRIVKEETASYIERKVAERIEQLLTAQEEEQTK